MLQSCEEANGAFGMSGGQASTWNHNVITTFVFRCSFALSIGLWNWGNGSAYVYLLEHRSNQVIYLTTALVTFRRHIVIASICVTQGTGHGAGICVQSLLSAHPGP